MSRDFIGALLQLNAEKGVPQDILIHTLEQAIEFLREDECVEITPEAVRLRKNELDATRRAKAARRAKRSPAS